MIVFRRADSPLWQFRYRIRNGTWHRQSTKKASLELAVEVACEAYDLARFRQRLGLAHTAHSFAQIAAATLEELGRQIDAARGKNAADSYVSCKTGVRHGWISPNAKIPRLTTIGIKSVARPAFTRAEIDQLLAAMPEWSVQGRLAIERITKSLVGDYVEVLLYTGMRHGTEALGIRWQHVSWHTDKGVRYLRIWVDGKTGGRWLIAKHAAVDALKRLHTRQSDIAGMTFEKLLTSNCSQLVFRCAGLHQPARVDDMFKRLLKDTGLLLKGNGQDPIFTTVYLRHFRAT